MAEIKNAWLEKYEIKGPDYDYVDREHIAMKDTQYESLRYNKTASGWKSKKQTKSLFRKKRAKLMFIGDITCFEKQFEEAKQGETYDFRYEFENVKPLFEQADLVVGNLETMIFPEAPYRTEKYVAEQNFHCNAPIEFLDAVRYAGIDMVTNANNHDLDTGAVGIGETIDYVEKFGFIHTGTFKSDKKRYEIIDVNGFKIAVTAFATDHNNKKCNLTPEGVDFLLNDYSKAKAKAIIKEARKDGAELVFTCIHWGRENKVVHNNAQKKLATELAEMGYDCIIGSHPHVLQPFSMINLKDKNVPVFYSMGNFLSHNVNNQKARSVIACFDLVRNKDGIDIECSYIPIFTSKNYGKKKYTVIPIKAITIDPRNINKKELIEQIVGDEISINRDIKITECIETIDNEESKPKKQELDLSTVKSYPVLYDNNKFVYSIFEDHAEVEKISDISQASSYTVQGKVLGLPTTAIKEGAFEAHPIMKKINFTKNLTFVSKAACKNATLLEGFQLGKNVEEICEEAFFGCSNLNAAVMKNSVKKIGAKAFANCVSLVNVKIPSSVESIADDAFEGCNKAVFYCEAESYAEHYARSHGFKVVIMNL